MSSGNTPNRVLFVDIDGVLIAGPQLLVNRLSSSDRIFPDTTVAVLNEICKVSGAKVVFNTTHNQSWEGIPKIGEALTNHGFDKDHIHPGDPKTKYKCASPILKRDEAIVEWLSRHDEVDQETGWMVLDDALCAKDPHMVLVDPDSGLHVGHANQVLEFFNCRPIIMFF